MTPLIGGSVSGQIHRDQKSRMMVARGWKEGGMGSYCLMGPAFQFGKMKEF